MSKSLEKFKARYYKFKDMPSVSALSLDGIKLTKDVKQFIKKHHMKIKAGVAYYPPNKKLRREPLKFTVSGKKKKYKGRGY
jgi:hypothetical protein